MQSAAQTVIDALRAVFILDPVPALMRQYAQRRDTTLRRRADNISAVIGALRDDPARWGQLRDLVRALPEQQVAEIDVERSQLDDVMLVLRERFDGTEVPFSARVMSDGMLQREDGTQRARPARVSGPLPAGAGRRLAGRRGHASPARAPARPGKSQQPDAIREDRVGAGESLLLPTAAIIETGNHIAQVAGGGMRRTCDRCMAVLRSAKRRPRAWSSARPERRAWWQTHRSALVGGGQRALVYGPPLECPETGDRHHEVAPYSKRSSRTSAARRSLYSRPMRAKSRSSVSSSTV